MLPEQRRYYYEMVKKTPPKERDELAREVEVRVGDRWIWAAEHLFVRIVGASVTWVYRYTRHGKTRSMKLGGYTDEREGHGKITLDGALSRAWRLDRLRESTPDIDLLELRQATQRWLRGDTECLIAMVKNIRDIRLLLRCDPSPNDQQKTKIRRKAIEWGLLPLAHDGQDETRSQAWKAAEAAFCAELENSEADEQADASEADPGLQGYAITTLEQKGNDHIFDRESGIVEGAIGEDDD